jgi:hypothetical protein
MIITLPIKLIVLETAKGDINIIKSSFLNIHIFIDKVTKNIATTSSRKSLVSHFISTIKYNFVTITVTPLPLSNHIRKPRSI